MASIENHTVKVVEMPADNRFKYQVQCACGWQSHVDSDSEAENVAMRHQQSRGFNPEKANQIWPSVKANETVAGTGPTTATPGRVLKTQLVDAVPSSALEASDPKSPSATPSVPGPSTVNQPSAGMSPTGQTITKASVPSPEQATGKPVFAGTIPTTPVVPASTDKTSAMTTPVPVPAELKAKQDAAKQDNAPNQQKQDNPATPIQPPSLAQKANPVPPPPTQEKSTAPNTVQMPTTPNAQPGAQTAVPTEPPK